MLRSLCRALGLALFVAATGCQAGGAKGDEEYVKLDDMEGGLAESQWSNGPLLQRVRWYASTGKTCPWSEMMPEPWFPADQTWADNRWAFAACEPPHRTRGPEDSRWAAHVLSTQPWETAPRPQDSERCWGANLTVDLAQPPPVGSVGGVDSGEEASPAAVDGGEASPLPELPVNLEAYAGLVFWAKATSLPNQRIQVLLRDRNSDHRGGKCETPPDSGIDVEGSKKCYNDFSVVLELTDSFTPYRVLFSDLWRDPTWGAWPNPYAPDLAHIYQIAFQVNAPKCVADPNATCAGQHIPLGFDFWIDDLYLLKRP